MLDSAYICVKWDPIDARKDALSFLGKVLQKLAIKVDSFELGILLNEMVYRQSCFSEGLNPPFCLQM